MTFRKLNQDGSETTFTLLKADGHLLTATRVIDSKMAVMRTPTMDLDSFIMRTEAITNLTDDDFALMAEVQADARQGE